ncbi:MAG: hypothetical protein SchgKO_13820 [Schleiferiaceae bacterium]
MMRRLLIWVVALLLPMTTYAQIELGLCEGYEPDKKAQKQVDKAVKALNKKDIKMARVYLSSALRIQEDNPDALYLMGDLSIKERNTRKCEAYWNQLLEVCPNYLAEVQFYLGVVTLENGSPEKAEVLLETFLKNGERDRGYDKEAKLILKEIKLKRDLFANPIPFEPKPVLGVSTSDDEYLAIISPDGRYCFFTRRYKKVNKYAGPGQGGRMVEEFFKAEALPTDFTLGDALESPFNQNYNEGGPSITADNKELYFTVCMETPQGQNCDIYYTKVDDLGFWSSLRSVGDHINSPDSWESQPSVSANGDVLIFSSNRKGGRGGLDLYICHKNPDGTWSAPENMGKAINTRKNEKSPFLHSDSRTLYFASEGHVGLGGFDIFYSHQDIDGNWSDPSNIGYPINTESDELGLFVSLDGETGYFNSNKLKGPGGWDLYSFAFPEPVRPEKVALIRGELVDEDHNVVEGAELEIKNLATKEVQNVKVNQSTGEYTTVVRMEPEQDLIVKVKSEGAAFSSRFIDSDKPGVIEANLAVSTLAVGKEYKLNDINFATNSYELLDKTMMVIDEFSIFLEENPRVKISIEGHTDNVGNASENKTLSQNRARVVYQYLIDLGIPASRMTYKGFGATRPVAGNDTEEGKQQNRRTVFRITSK